MKISEMSTTQASAVLVKVMQPMQNILSDENVMPGIQAVMNQETPEKAIALAMRTIVPDLLKSHTGDFCAIIGAINSKPQKAIEQQNIITTMAQVKEIFSDKELLDFFKSSALPMKTEEIESV